MYSWQMNFFCYTGHGSEISLSLLESTGSVLDVFTAETRPLFDVFFGRYIARPVGDSFLGFTTEFKGQETEG